MSGRRRSGSSGRTVLAKSWGRAPTPSGNEFQPQSRVRSVSSRHSTMSPGSAPVTSTGPIIEYGPVGVAVAERLSLGESHPEGRLVAPVRPGVRVADDIARLDGGHRRRAPGRGTPSGPSRSWTRRRERLEVEAVGVHGRHSSGLFLGQGRLHLPYQDLRVLAPSPAVPRPPGSGAAGVDLC